MKRIARGVLVVAGALLATPALAATADVALLRSAATLGAGQYAWPDARGADGAISIVVSIPLQEIFVYRGASLIAVSSVSTGRVGHETPTGGFAILQKAITHRSNKYNNAPMPYMQRLTWDGVAIHAGYDPGRADSHGCVRVPLAFAKRLYAITSIGARVSIVGEATAPGLPVDYARVRPPRDVPVTPDDAALGLDPETDATRVANLGAQPTAPAVAPAETSSPQPASPEAR